LAAAAADGAGSAACGDGGASNCGGGVAAAIGRWENKRGGD